MVKVILYTSNTGFTKKYAEMLSQELGITAYSWKERTKIEKQVDIIYMGWLMGGKIKNYTKANSNYKIRAICAVGMGVPTEKQNMDIIKNNGIKEPLFYLQGGFDKTKLKGVYKFMMNCMEKMIRPNLEQKQDKTEEEKEMLEMMEKGKDCVKEENLKEVITWYSENFSR